MHCIGHTCTASVTLALHQSPLPYTGPTCTASVPLALHRSHLHCISHTCTASIPLALHRSHLHCTGQLSQLNLALSGEQAVKTAQKDAADTAAKYIAAQKDAAQAKVSSPDAAQASNKDQTRDTPASPVPAAAPVQVSFDPQPQTPQSASDLEPQSPEAMLRGVAPKLLQVDSAAFAAALSDLLDQEFAGCNYGPMLIEAGFDTVGQRSISHSKLPLRAVAFCLSHCSLSPSLCLSSCSPSPCFCLLCSLAVLASGRLAEASTQDLR